MVDELEKSFSSEVSSWTGAEVNCPALEQRTGL